MSEREKMKQLMQELAAKSLEIEISWEAQARAEQERISFLENESHASKLDAQMFQEDAERHKADTARLRECLQPWTDPAIICTCDPAYLGVKRRDPQCFYHEWKYEIDAAREAIERTK